MLAGSSSIQHQKVVSGLPVARYYSYIYASILDTLFLMDYYTHHNKKKNHKPKKY